MNDKTASAWRRSLIVLQILLLVLVVVDITLTIRCANKIDSMISQRERPSLPCAAIPTRLVLEHPECAQRLLEAMNVTNVRVVARGAGRERPDRNELLATTLP